MIHSEVLEEIKRKKHKNNFIFPYYGKLSTSEVGPTILSMLGAPNERATLALDDPNLGMKHNKVVFFLVDGLGYDHVIKYNKEARFLSKLAGKGEIYPITSVFPSTTPAALTTIHTGLTPQEHGLPEWTVYFEEFDRIIETFPFRPIMTGEKEILLTMGGSPDMLYKGETIYQKLAKSKIKSYVFISHEYATSAYSRRTQEGSEVVQFSDFKDLGEKLVSKLGVEEGPSYYFVYWSLIDSTGHVFGPESQEHINSIKSFSESMETVFLDKLDKESSKDTMFILTSDHGQTSINSEDIVFLNDYIELEESYLWGKSSKSILPTGSPHDVFLHIYGPKVENVLKFLKRELKEKAYVLTIEKALSLGLFGLNKPSERFLKRIGSILIIPHKGYHVWYKHDPNMHYGQRGMHGGLSEAEMIVPFSVARLSELL